MNLNKILSLSLGLVVLATVAVLTGTSTVGASPHINSLIAAPPPPSVPVNVVNTPLAVSGTVNANINGTPTVNVASLPPVNATLTSSSITVANPVASPLPVHDVNDPADNPYSATVCFSPSAVEGCTPAASTFTIPGTTPSGQAVKQLVVDFVSGTCYTVPGGEVTHLSLLVTPPSGVSYYSQSQYSLSFVPAQTLSAGGSISVVYSQQTRAYVIPNSTISFGASYSTQYLGGAAPPPLFCDMNLQGHFVTQ